MSCKFDKQLLYYMADDTIEPLEKIFAEEHLKYCSECKKELEKIRELDKEFNEIEFEIPIPERLSIISQLLVENCIAEIEKEDLKLKVHNYKEDMKFLRRTINKAYKIQYNNPCNKFIEKSLTETANFIGKPVKEYYKKKMAKSKIGKFFKVV